MEDPHEHSWVAAVLFHLTAEEAQLVSEYPDMILDTAAGAPSETIAPFCTECLVSLDPRLGEAAATGGLRPG